MDRVEPMKYNWLWLFYVLIILASCAIERDVQVWGGYATIVRVDTTERGKKVYWKAFDGVTYFMMEDNEYPYGVGYVQNTLIRK